MAENVKKYTLLKLRELQSVSFVEIDPSSSYALVSFVDGRFKPTRERFTKL